MKSFSQFINESQEELDAVLYLLQVGLISAKGSWSDLAPALVAGKISAEQLAGVDTDVEIKYEPGTEDFFYNGFFEEVIRTWRGPGGVRALWAEGTVPRRGPSLDLFLSTGDQLHYDEDNLGYNGSHAWLERDGQRRVLDEETLNEIKNSLLDKYQYWYPDSDTGLDYWPDLFNELVNHLAGLRR